MSSGDGFVVATNEAAGCLTFIVSEQPVLGGLLINRVSYNISKILEEVTKDLSSA